MEQIKMEAPSAPAPSEFEREILAGNAKKKKFTKNFFNVAGIVVGVFLMFAVVVLVTVDVHIITLAEAVGLLLEFFLLLFVSYSMYITCADSGMRAGLISATYKESVGEFNKHKKYIIDMKLQSRLGDFCCHYVTEELKATRTTILAIVGISYEVYLAKYVGGDPVAIKQDPALSKVQIDAILEANAIAPINLTPDMIMKRGRGGGKRDPLGVKPETKKKVNFILKFVYSVLVTLGMSMIVLDDIAEITLAVLATCCLKLLVVVLNGFQGYKFGYENIVIDTVEYMDDQTDLMKQAIQYIEGKSIDSAKS
jgi:uncharacterized membrane protein